MTRKIAAGCFAAMFALAVSASAQTPPSQPPSTPSPAPASPTSPYPSGQASATAERGGTKVTGCIQAGTQAGSFELTNVKKGDSASSSATAPAPGASASPSSSDKSTVKLVASPSVDLSTHVGHTVEVSGKWAAAAGGDAAAAPSASSSMGKEFQVSSIKMVSSTCSAGTN
jgi:hypothetical protein